MKEKIAAPVLAASTVLLFAASVGASPLQALTATSGPGVEKILDGDPKTVWKPGGDATGEGVLFRFESPTAVTGLGITACEKDVALDVFLNGSKLYFDERIPAANRRDLKFTDSRTVRSVFLKLAGSDDCLGEVNFIGAGDRDMAIEAPRMVKGTVSASSTLAPVDAYHVSYLFDKRDDFGWVEGKKGLGEGESITVSFGTAAEINALEIWNGYQRSKDHFRKNARARSLTLSADGGAPITLAIADTMGASKVKLPAPVKAKQLVLTIAKAQKGKKYPDLVISELRFWDGAGPFSLDTPDTQQRVGALQKSVAGSALGGFLDRQYVGFCDRGPSRRTSLKLRSNSSFVYYSTGEKDWGSKKAEQVFDGAWVVKKSDAGAAQVKLYGRKHLIATTWRPYQGESTRDTTRVAGGTIDLTPIKALGLEGLEARTAAWDDGREGPSCRELSGIKQAGFDDLVKRGGYLLEGKTILGVFWREK